MKKEYIYLALAAIAVWYFLYYNKEKSAAADTSANGGGNAGNGNGDDNVISIISGNSRPTNITEVGSRSGMEADQLQVFTMPASYKKLG